MRWPNRLSHIMPTWSAMTAVAISRRRPRPILSSTPVQAMMPATQDAPMRRVSAISMGVKLPVKVVCIPARYSQISPMKKAQQPKTPRAAGTVQGCWRTAKANTIAIGAIWKTCRRKVPLSIPTIRRHPPTPTRQTTIARPGEVLQGAPPRTIVMGHPSFPAPRLSGSVSRLAPGSGVLPGVVISGTLSTRHTTPLVCGPQPARRGAGGGTLD